MSKHVVYVLCWKERDSPLVCPQFWLTWEDADYARQHHPCGADTISIETLECASEEVL